MKVDIAMYLIILAIGVTAYFFGKTVGQSRGYDCGYLAGRRDGRDTWIKAMERKRGPNGTDELSRTWTDLTL